MRILGDGEPSRERALEKLTGHLMSGSCQIKELEGKVVLEQILRKLESGGELPKEHQKARVEAIKVDDGEAHQDGPTHVRSHHRGGGIVLTRSRRREEIEIEVEDDLSRTPGHHHRGEIDTAMSQADGSGALLHIRTATQATSGEE